MPERQAQGTKGRPQQKEAQGLAPTHAAGTPSLRQLRQVAQMPASARQHYPARFRRNNARHQVDETGPPLLPRQSDAETDGYVLLIGEAGSGEIGSHSLDASPRGLPAALTRRELPRQLYGHQKR